MLLRRRRPALARGAAGAGGAAAPAEAAGAEHAAADHVGDGHRAEVEVDLVAEFLPQVVGLAAALVAAATERLPRRAAGRADRLVDGEDDVGDAGLARRLGQEVAAA